MLTVYSFPSAYGLPSLSPFCSKLLVHLTLAGVEYETKRGDPRSSPTKKLPALKDGDRFLSDSSQIIEHLRSTQGVDLDAGLGPRERALTHMVRHTLEDHFYWAILYGRWVADEGWERQGPAVAAMLPAAVRWFLPGLLRKGVKKSAHAHGLGRHAPETIYAMGAADLASLEQLIEGAPFFFGDQPRSIDVLIHAFAGAVLFSKSPQKLLDATPELPKVWALCQAVEAKYRELGGKNV